MYAAIQMIPLKFQSTPSAWRVTALHVVMDHNGRVFQSTPSAWRVTAEEQMERLTGQISIHTLRVEGDCKSAQKISTILFKSNRPAEKLPTGRA